MVRARHDFKQFSYRMLLHERMTKTIFEIDAVVISAADFLDGDDLLIGKLLDDLLDDAEGQSHPEGNLRKPHFWIEVKADEYMGVIAHESPLGSLGKEALNAGEVVSFGFFETLAHRGGGLRV